jgi:ferric-dicitrate binding protein FerR (iron transport regulator)
MQEKFWILFSKKLSGEATPDEMATLGLLISAHPEWQYAIQNLEDFWKNHPKNEYGTEEDAYLLHLHRMNEMNIPFGDMPVEMPAASPAHSRRKWYWAAAAVVALTAALFGILKPFISNSGEEPANQANEISTRQGSKTKVQLPDGSVVWLNAGSKLTYNKDFGQHLREVTLSGEGFFDVVKNKEKPFIIHTSSINIKVLGTAFNVKAYPEDKQTETSLIHGSIEVTIKDRPKDKIILSPSEKLVVKNVPVVQPSKTVTNGAAVTEVKQVPEVSSLVSINKLRYSPADSTVAETEWVNNRLVFRDEAFSDVAIRMQRWYDVRIEIRDEQLAGERLSGSFENETILQALDALKFFLPFKYDQNGNKIIIHR